MINRPTTLQRVAALEATAVGHQQQLIAAVEFIKAMKAIMIESGIWTDNEIEKEVRRRSEVIATASYANLGLGQEYPAAVAGFLLAMGVTPPKEPPKSKPHLRVVPAQGATT